MAPIRPPQQNVWVNPSSVTSSKIGRLTTTGSSVGGMFADLGADHDSIDCRYKWFGMRPVVEAGNGFDTGVFQGNSRSVRIRSIESWS